MGKIPQLPIGEQEVQIQPPSLLDKLKIHKVKILGGILGTFILVGAVFGAYKFGQKQVQPTPQPTPIPTVSPAPDETANWKSYTNTKYGYSIKYPTDWSFKEETAQLIRFSPKEKGGYIQFVISSNVLRGITRCEEDHSSCNFVIDNKIFGERTKTAIKDEIFLPGILGEYDMRATLYKGEKDYILIVNLMLSTFKFLE